MNDINKVWSCWREEFAQRQIDSADVLSLSGDNNMHQKIINNQITMLKALCWLVESSQE